MQDRHEVILEANVTKFKNQMKEATVVSENFNKVLQNSRKFIHSEWVNGIYGVSEVIKSGSEEIAKQNQLYAKQVKILSSIKNLKVNKDTTSSGFTRGVLDKKGGYSGKIAAFSGEAQQATKNVEQLADRTQNTGITIDKAFNKGLKSIKRLTIGFLGARSAFMLFRKYLGEYSNQNEEFAQKMQLTTGILVNTLAPAFEFFANVIQYVVIGLARIIELLFGVNILGKTIDNSLKGASKSAKEFNDNLSGLDEISNISESQGGLSTGIGSQLNALNEFQKKIKEVDEWLARTGIKKFLTDLQPIVRDVFDWISEHPLGTLGIIGAFELLKISIPAILGISGGTLGLFGIATALTILAGISIKNVIDEFNDLRDMQQDNIDRADDLIEKWKTLGLIAEEKSPEWSEEQGQNVFEQHNMGLGNDFKNIYNKLDDLSDYSWISKNVSFNVHHKNYVTDKKLLDGYIESMKTYLKTQGLLYQQGKLTNEQEIEYYENLVASKNVLEDIEEAGYNTGDALEEVQKGIANYKGDVNLTSERTKKFKEQVVGLYDGFFNLGKLKVKPEIEVNATGNAETKLSSIWGYLDKINNNPSKGVLNLATGVKNLISNLPKFATGGMPDEGQMFVAREGGPELVGTIGGHTAVANNDQIVASVSAGVYDAVVSAMSGQSDRPIVLNIDGREFAKVTYSDYQAEGSRRGTNTALRRY